MAANQSQMSATIVREFTGFHANMHPQSSQRNRRMVVDCLTVPLTGCGKTMSARQNVVGSHVWLNRKIFPQDAQKGCSASKAGWGRG
jgi:hypothetical protein